MLFIPGITTWIYYSVFVGKLSLYLRTFFASTTIIDDDNKYFIILVFDSVMETENTDTI